jgi:GNAT superfamily N-acetyltransferase
MDSEEGRDAHCNRSRAAPHPVAGPDVRMLTITPALLSEQAVLEALQRRASLANEADRAALLAHPDAIALPIEQIAGGRVMVARRDGAIVGFAVVLRRVDDAAELDGLFVEPSAWRGGIGRSLVEAACRMVMSEGAAALHVIGSRQAEGFYRACGFALLGEAQTRFGAALAMRRTLDGRS